MSRSKRTQPIESKLHRQSSHPHNHHTSKQITSHWIGYGYDIRSNQSTTTTKSIIWILGMNSGLKQPHPSSTQRVTYDCQHQASLYIIVINWRKRRAAILQQQQGFEHVSIGVDPSTHSCACNRNVHYMWSRSTSRPFHSCAIQGDHSLPSGLKVGKEALEQMIESLRIEMQMNYFN